MKKLVDALRNFENTPNSALKGSSSRKYIKCDGLGLYLTMFSAEIKRFMPTLKNDHTLPGGTQSFIYWKLAIFPGRTGAEA